MRTAQACLLAAGILALAAPAANAGGWGGRYGVARESSQESSFAWSVRESSQESSSWEARGDRGACPMVDRREDFARDLRCAGPADVRLGSLFFEGAGGVGPFPDFATGGGGGGVIIAGGEASAFASASASASASARVSVRFSGHGHGGGGGHTGGCGCKK